MYFTGWLRYGLFILEPQLMKGTTLKRIALGGVAGPILFTVIRLLCANLRSDYSHIHHFISELGATGTSNADLMNWAGFIPAGAMIVLFAVSLTQLLPKGILTRAGSALILIFGIGMVAVGFYSCDPGCPREGSIENNLHDQISGPSFMCAILGILILGISFRRLTFWREIWLYSVVSALVSVGFLLGLISSLEAYSYTGLWQRLLLLTIFLWIVMVALKLFKSSMDIEPDYLK
jgi:hypothetical membrane protein